MSVIELKQLVRASLSPKPGAEAGDEPGRDWRGALPVLSRLKHMRQSLVPGGLGGTSEVALGKTW